jgi:hypothetical protein
MGFINACEGRVNLQVFEYRQPGQDKPSDPEFEFMTGSEPAKFAKLGMTHEIVGPDPQDGGPKLICVCPNADSARMIKNALDLLGKL